MDACDCLDWFRYNGNKAQINVKRLLSVFFILSFLILLWLLLSYSSAELAAESDVADPVVLVADE